jgi:hypothetical protein
VQQPGWRPGLRRDLDSFLTTGSCVTDDLDRQYLAPQLRRRGARGPWTGWMARDRLAVATTFGWLPEPLGLAYPRARTVWGLGTRLAAKLAALNLAILFHVLTAAPRLSGVSPFSL